MSAAKVSAVLGIIFGLVVAIGIMVGLGVQQYMGRFYTAYQTYLPMTGYAMLVILPIAYGVTGFVGTYICVLLYNWVAKQVGGVKVDLK